jgi:hypothetical protein
MAVRGIAVVLVASLLTLAACAPTTIHVPTASVPVGHAVLVPADLRAPDGAAVHAVAITHAMDGWHAFLAWSTQVGVGCADKTDRTLTIHADALWHGCSRTIWNLDGRYVAGPHGTSLIALPVRVEGAQVVVQPR